MISYSLPPLEFIMVERLIYLNSGRLLVLASESWRRVACMILLLFSVSLRSGLPMLLIFLFSSSERTCSDRLYFCLVMMRSRSFDIENFTICMFRFSSPYRVANSGSLPRTDLFFCDSDSFLASYLLRLLILRSCPLPMLFWLTKGCDSFSE